MRWNPLSRRHFLQGLGAALALPQLESLAPKTAKADLLTKSFIGIPAWNGLYRMYGASSQLMPAATENGNSLVGFDSFAVPNRHTIHHGSLTGFAAQNKGRISDVIDESFAPFFSKMMMLQGFDYTGLGYYHHSAQFGNWHETATQDEGNPPMASLDVVLSDFYAKMGWPRDVVAYSASYADNLYGCSFRADGTPTTSRFYDPATLWDKYFGNSQIPTDFKVLLVDRVLDDYKSLRGNARLGSDDKQRLDAHIAHLATTETNIRKLSAVCMQMRPDVNATDRALVLRTMNSVIVGLISCGMCNIFLGWAMALLNEDPDQWHVWSHQGYANDTDSIADLTSYGKMIEQNRAVMQDMCLDLAQKLQDVGQLDNSLIVIIQEHNKRGHESWNVPVITIGSAGGAFITDQYVDFRDLTDGDDKEFSRFGYPMNQLYANILGAFGMASSDYEPLNKNRATGVWPFKPNSGYGVPMIHPDAATNMGAHYKDRWAAGEDLSAPLPLIRS